MKNRFALTTITLAAIAGLSVFPRPASAQYFQMQFTNVGFGENVDFKENGNLVSGQFAGQLQARLFNGPSFSQPLAGYNTFCVDLDHHVGYGDKYLVLPTSTSTGLHNGGEIAYLFNTYRNTIADNDHGAALQVSIWKLLLDNNIDLSSGNFQLVSGGNVLADANAYLTDALGKFSTSQWGDAGLGGKIVDHEQNLLLPATEGVKAVPEPGLMSLLCAVPTMGLALLRRRRLKG